MEATEPRAERQSHRKVEAPVYVGGVLAAAMKEKDAKIVEAEIARQAVPS